MPAGGERAATVAICRASRPLCPKCNRPVRRVHGQLGSFLARCERSRNGGECGQHLHILGAAEGVCLVLPISKAEFDRLSRAHEHNHTPQADMVYDQLGVLAER